MPESRKRVRVRVRVKRGANTRPDVLCGTGVSRAVEFDSDSDCDPRCRPPPPVATIPTTAAVRPLDSFFFFFFLFAFEVFAKAYSVCAEARSADSAEDRRRVAPTAQKTGGA